MKIVLCLSILLGLCCTIYAQSTVPPPEDPCAQYTEKQECTDVDGCLWDYGYNCTQELIGFCRSAANQCYDAVKCAYDPRRASPVTEYYKFPRCIPFGWVLADRPDRCYCAPPPPPTCSPACTGCSTCKDGQCVDYAPQRFCSAPLPEQTKAPGSGAREAANSPCPYGYKCVEKECSSYCEPDCPPDKQVSCFADPCREDQRPPFCDPSAICIPIYCGTCQARYINATDGTETCNTCDRSSCGPVPEGGVIQCWDGSFGGYTGRCIQTKTGDCKLEYRECPPQPCNPVACDLWCPLGFKLDPNTKCPICACIDPPVCDTTARAISPCPVIDCFANGKKGYPVIKPGDCCPSCEYPCDNVLCPAIAECGVGYKFYIPPGGCCPICIPIPDCTNVVCGVQPPKCADDEIVVKKECCLVCQKRVDCTLVRCPQVDVCPPGYKKIERDCCSTCVEIPPCSDVICPQDVVCPIGSVFVKRDLECCGHCEKVDECATVLCAKPNCPIREQIKRRGECCPTCWQCKDDVVSASNKVCNENDDPVCPSGIWKGDDCTVPVPDVDRVQVVLIVIVCPKDIAFAPPSCPTRPWDDQTVRLKIAQYTTIRSDYITTTFDGLIPDDLSCCYVWKIIITATKTDSFDPVVEVDNMVAAINQNGDADGISVDMDSISSTSDSTEPKKNDSTHVVAGWMAAVFALLLACCF